jgi:hypothetical protein
MFRCELCRFVVPVSTPCNRIVVETRRVDYPSRPRAHFAPGSEGGKGKWIDDPGGRGTEIVREVNACAACASRAAAVDRESEDPPPALDLGPVR